MDSLGVTELAALRPGDAAAEASPQGMQARKFAEQFNTNFSRNPMGSGPYKFHSWQTGQAVVLQRDPHYWGVGKEGMDQPYIDQRTMRVFNNPDAALVALKAGEVDTMGLMPIQHLKQTSGARFDKQFAKHLFFTPSYSYIGWNNAHPIFSDRRVRQAMTYLTNRQQMVKTLLFELGEVVNGPLLGRKIDESFALRDDPLKLTEYRPPFFFGASIGWQRRASRHNWVLCRLRSSYRH